MENSDKAGMPVWDKVALVAVGVAAATVFIPFGVHLLSKVPSMDAAAWAAWAAWAQAVFSVLAIVATAVIASRAERRMEREKREAVAAGVQLRCTPVLQAAIAFREMATLIAPLNEGSTTARISDRHLWATHEDDAVRVLTALQSLQLRDCACAEEFVSLGTSIQVLQITLDATRSTGQTVLTISQRLVLEAASEKLYGEVADMQKLASQLSGGSFRTVMHVL
jgi:hypothetical protein